MSESFAALVQFLAPLLILAGYGAALVEWARSDAAGMRPARTASFVWAGAALTLVALLAALRWIAFDLADARGFLEGGGQILLLQALGTIFVIQAGQRWAAQAGARPIRPERRRWRRWPWGWLGGALAIMIGWTLLLAQIVPHRGGPEDLTRLLRMDEMNPWLELPFAIALLTLAPILEECFFRQYLLYRIAAWMAGGRPSGPWIGNAIFISSVLFALAHPARIEPFWFKWMEIFVPGVVLGVASWRHGLEAAIALHWGFNIALFALAPFSKTLGL